MGAGARQLANIESGQLTGLFKHSLSPGANDREHPQIAQIVVIRLNLPNPRLPRSIFRARALVAIQGRSRF